MRNERGQAALEVLLLSIMGFLILGAILGRGNKGGIPLTLKQTTPKLAQKVEDRLETGSAPNTGFAVRWGRPPK